MAQPRMGPSYHRYFFLDRFVFITLAWGTVYTETSLLFLDQSLINIFSERLKVDRMPEKTVNLVIKRPVSIREKVHSVIRDDILNGRMPPGERIIENRIAQDIKTSRMPVREALHSLEREGLIESIPRVGYRVKELGWEEVEEICEILARASGSQHLLELCQTLRRHMLRYRIQSLYFEESAIRAIKGHRHILESIKKKDKSGVEPAIRKHLGWVKFDIKENIFNQQHDKSKRVQ